MARETNGDPPTPSQRDFDREIELLALLEDPVRRSLYRHVVRQAEYVSRDDAARAVGVARGLAAFHLDKLAEEGLLEITYRRPAGRTGPGAGRPAKLYRRSPRQVTVSLPPRDYELMAHLLASALDQELPDPVSCGLADAARAAGAALAVQAKSLIGARADRRRLVDAGLEVLWRQGYEPKPNGAEIELWNCPFSAVATRHGGLVCPMNLAMLDAFAAKLGSIGFAPRLEPRDGRCCVVFQVTTSPVVAPEAG